MGKWTSGFKYFILGRERVDGGEGGRGEMMECRGEVVK